MSIPTQAATHFALTHRNAIVGVCAAAALAYGAYKAYNSETAIKFRKFQKAVGNYVDAMETVSDTCALVASDFQKFLTSDATEVPRSLAQISTLLQSREVQGTLGAAVQTVVRSAAAASAEMQAEQQGPGVLDKVIEAVLSDRGRSLLGMAVGIATKNATATFCEYLERSQATAGASGSSNSMQAVLQMMASDQGEKVISLVITKSVRTAVSSYIEGYAGYNIYDDMVKSIVKQEHRDAITDILSRMTACFTREVASAIRKSKAPANGAQHAANASGAHAANRANGVAEAGSTSSVSITELPPSRSSIDGLATSASASARCGSMATSSSQSNMAAVVALPSKNASRSLTSAASGGAIPLPYFPPHHQASWLKQVVDLVKEREVRALAVDVVRATTREATRGVVETLMQGFGAVGEDAEAGGKRLKQMMAVSAQRVYVMLTLLVAMFMYALSPRTIAL